MEELRGQVALAWSPAMMNYGMREFGIQGSNGYYLAFTAPARNAEVPNAQTW